MEFEKLGAFYLGKEYDEQAGAVSQRLAMYDARDLTTHAVCVGMTGSGKTGLCIGLLEEAAIDGVPALIIDPKGDLTNLLLTFPDLKPSDFRPWVNPEDARKQGLTLDEAAGQQAKLWRAGLAEWGQDGERIRRLHRSADFRIYTPGSDAGLPVSLLQSFAAPKLDWDVHAELLRERIAGLVSSLLGLVGVEADPLASREFTLLSALFEHYWRRGESLDFAKLILSIEKPPIRRLGVFDVDTFFPHRDRFKLALSLNNIIASPAFQSWLQGQPLEIPGFLAAPDGRPRHSIFYIAHLNDAERMFFVSMLLNQFLGWVRAQPGTTSLRAVLYMDEIFGFLPPVANPPSKRPLLTLLKQARAFGTGLVLATQNPIDLDYKALTNAGTWFIGRLQTERDKMRVLDGLEGASSQAGQALDRKSLSQTISNLGKRVFMLHNVHESEPILFTTRWVMSYLRGPLTRNQLRLLTESVEEDPASTATEPSVGASTHAEASAVGVDEAALSAPPVLDSEIQQAFQPASKRAEAAAAELDRSEGASLPVVASRLLYRPLVCGAGRVRFVDHRKKVDHAQEFGFFAEAPEGLGRISWDEIERVPVALDSFSPRPLSQARFESVPETINEPLEWRELRKELEGHLYASSSLMLQYNESFEAYSAPGEDGRDFRLRLNQLVREKRDEEVEKIKRRHERQLRTIDRRLQKARIALEKKESVASARKRETFVNIGETLLSVFMGRRRSVSSSLSKYRMSSTAKMAAEEAEENVEGLEKEIEQLRAELQRETEAIEERWGEAAEDIKEVAVKPRKTDISVDFLGLVWKPYWKIDLKDDFGVRSRLVDAG